MPTLAKFTSADNRLRFTVDGGLNYIRGNSAPHFSLTASGRDRGSAFGGCCHDIILEHFPKFADLAALHLSDIHGVPMHAEANGWYWLVGAINQPNIEQYHGGNHTRGGNTPEHCLQVFADHIRVSLAEAEAIKADVAAQWNIPDMRKRWGEICEAQKPRWTREAQECIAKHSLVVYGDPWPVAA
jgi:hypothetical protein